MSELKCLECARVPKVRKHGRDWLEPHGRHPLAHFRHFSSFVTTQVQSSNSAVVAIGYYGEVGGSRFKPALVRRNV